MISSVITQTQKAPSIPQTKMHRPWWRHLGQGFCFVLLALALLEGYFRLAGVGGGEFLQPDLQLGTKHIPDKQVIWRTEGFSNNRMSSVGLRDTEHTVSKEPSVYRIALLGDSLVEALQVDLNDTFGKLLESRLNQTVANGSVKGSIYGSLNGSLNNHDKNRRYEAINFGCGGYSTGQEVLQYEREAAKYKPDAIFLFYNRGDSLESVVTNKDRKKAEPRPYFYLDQSGQLKEDDSVLAANFDKLKPQPLRDFLGKNSTIYGALNQADFSLTLNEPHYRKIKGWLNSAVSWSANIMHPHEMNTAYGLSKPRPYISVIPTQASLLQQGLYSKAFYPDQDEMTVTKALISKLANQAAKNGQTFVLVIYPNIDHYSALTEQAKQLKILARENHFLYLDLSPAFLADPQPRSNFALYHFNKKGHITVANQLLRVFDNTN